MACDNASMRILTWNVVRLSYFRWHSLDTRSSDHTRRTSCGHAWTTTRTCKTETQERAALTAKRFSSMKKKNVEGLLDELDAQIFCFQGSPLPCSVRV